MPGLRTQHYLVQRVFVSAPYCELSHIGVEGYEYPQGRGRRNDLPAWAGGYAWRGRDRWQERIWLDTVYEQGGVFMPAGHPPHICLFCGEKIMPDEEEVKLVLGPINTRYTHSSWEACQAASRQHSLAFRHSFPGKQSEGRRRTSTWSGPPDQRGGILERDRPPRGETDMASDTRQILKGFRDKGYVAELGRNNSHWFIRNPADGELLTVMPSTPSDIRGLNASRVILKRAPDLKAASRSKRMARAAAALGASVPTVAPQVLTPAAEMAKEGHLSIPSVKAGKIVTAAWWLWDNLRKLAERDGERLEHHDTAGWYWNGTLQGVVSSLWPLIPEHRDDKNRREVVTALSAYLKATQHIVVLATHGRNDSDYWVSDVWRGGPNSVGLAVAEAKRAGLKLGGPLALNQKRVMATIQELAQGKYTEFATAEIVSRLGLDRGTVSSALHGVEDRDDFDLKHLSRGTWGYTPSDREPDLTEKEKETPMPATAARARNPHQRLAVLRAAQEHPDVLFSIQDMSGWLAGAPESSISTALRNWASKGFIERIDSGLYICRSGNTDGGEEGENGEEVRDTAPPAVQAPPAPPAAAPEPEVSAPRADVPKRIADLLRLRPDAKLYAEVYRAAGGTVIIVMDEDGDMHEIANG